MPITSFARLALFAIIWLWIPTWSIAIAQNLGATVVSTAQVRAELLAHAPQGVSSGAEVWVGLQLNRNGTPTGKTLETLVFLPPSNGRFPKE